jgi:hypothetical protein
MGRDRRPDQIDHLILEGQKIAEAAFKYFGTQLVEDRRQLTPIAELRLVSRATRFTASIATAIGWLIAQKARRSGLRHPWDFPAIEATSEHGCSRSDGQVRTSRELAEILSNGDKFVERVRRIASAERLADGPIRNGLSSTTQSGPKEF